MCRVCENGCVEDELHFINDCEKLFDERENMLYEIGSICDVSDLEGDELVKRVIQPDCLKITAKHLIIMMD